MSEALRAVTSLGDDADLLLKPDDWLENHRVGIQQKMALLADELRSILLAQHEKCRLRRARISQDSLHTILELRRIGFESDENKTA